MNHIMFNTDDWNLDHRVTSNVGYVTEVKGYNGETASVWRLADWNWSWTSLMHTFKPEKIRIIRLLFGLMLMCDKVTHKNLVDSSSSIPNIELFFTLLL